MCNPFTLPIKWKWIEYVLEPHATWFDFHGMQKLH
jgi:hypothetical protein